MIAIVSDDSQTKQHIMESVSVPKQKKTIAKKAKGDENGKKVAKKRSHKFSLLMIGKKLLSRYVDAKKPLKLKKETKFVLEEVAQDLLRTLGQRLMVIKKVEGTKTVSVDTLMRAASTFLSKKKMDNLDTIVTSTLKSRN